MHTGWGLGGGPQVNNNWGDLQGKLVKKPDGWGGYIESREVGGVKEYAATLKEIFEGDPKNVKA